MRLSGHQPFIPYPEDIKGKKERGVRYSFDCFLVRRGEVVFLASVLGRRVFNWSVSKRGILT